MSRRARSPDRTVSVDKRQKIMPAADTSTVVKPPDVVDCERSALPQRIAELLTDYQMRRQQGESLCFRVIPKLRSSVLKLLRDSHVAFQVCNNIVCLEAPQSGLKGMIAPDLHRSLGGTPHASLNCLVRPDGKTEMAPDVAWWSTAPTLQQRAKPALLPMPDLWIEIVNMGTSGDYQSAVAKLPKVRQGRPSCHFVVIVLPRDVTKVRDRPGLAPVVLEYLKNMVPRCPRGSLCVGYVPPAVPAVAGSLRFHSIHSNMKLQLLDLNLQLDVSVVIHAFL